MSEVSGEVTDLKAGLEIAYKVINDTQLKLEQVIPTCAVFYLLNTAVVNTVN